jgi:hypothetical protein
MTVNKSWYVFAGETPARIKERIQTISIASLQIHPVGLLMIYLQCHPYGARSAPKREGVVGETVGFPTGGRRGDLGPPTYRRPIPISNGTRAISGSMVLCAHGPTSILGMIGSERSWRLALRRVWPIVSKPMW